MNDLTAQALREKVLRVPPVARRWNTTFLRVPYSRKMAGRVYVYKDVGYALWIELEFDRGIHSFNMEPPPLTVAHGSKQFDIPMAAASVDRTGHMVLHFTQTTFELNVGDAAAGQLLSSQQWATTDTSIRVWRDLDDLRRLDRTIKAALLRYICAPHVVANAQIEGEIIGIMKDFRKLCVWDIFQKLRMHDEEEIKPALVNLIVEGKMFLNMSTRFSIYSELSLHDIFEA